LRETAVIDEGVTSMTANSGKSLAQLFVGTATEAIEDVGVEFRMPMLGLR